MSNMDLQIDFNSLMTFTNNIYLLIYDEAMNITNNVA